MAGSRPSPAPDDIQHSSLEVDHNCWVENDGKAAPMVGQDPKDEKIISYNDVGKQAVVVDVCNAQPESSRPTKEPPSTEKRKIFGLRRKKSLILLPVLLVLIIAGAVGGGVGGTVTARNRGQTATVPTNVPSLTPPQAPTTTRVPYANTGLAAMQWTDLDGTLHKRLYYQDKSYKIRESAWDNSTAFDAEWEINAISDAVKPGTPIAAAAG